MLINRFTMSTVIVCDFTVMLDYMATLSNSAVVHLFYKPVLECKCYNAILPNINAIFNLHCTLYSGVIFCLHVDD